MVSFWLTACAFALGLFILWFGELYLVPLFLISGYLAILIALVRTARYWKDLFNPLCVILAIGLIRFGLPGLLVMFGMDPQSESLLTMRLSAQDWQLGHVLALTGLLGIVLGWVMAPGRLGSTAPLQFGLSSGVVYTAQAAMIAGFAGLLLFFVRNAYVENLLSGGFRSVTIQVGTGKFFFLSFLLISGSVILSGCLLSKSGLKWISLVPVILAMLAFWGLGGRGRALTAPLSGLLLLWYLWREQRRWDRISLGSVFMLVVLGIPFMVWIAYFGQLYRGGLGLGGFFDSFSLPGLWGYFREAIFTDIGHLHALAGAVVLEPGLLAGTTFVHRLLWPLSDVLELPGRSTGIVIRELVVGSKEPWGLAASLMGDVYVNFGVLGIPIVMGLYGLLSKMMYVGFRRGSIHPVVYVLAAIHSVGMLISGIDLWVYASTILAFTLLTISLGRFLPNGRPAWFFRKDARLARGVYRRLPLDAMGSERTG
jgi:oligosaccharide repeat unit polymerase